MAFFLLSVTSCSKFWGALILLLEIIRLAVSFAA
jgi:hypothetical protein